MAKKNETSNKEQINALLETVNAQITPYRLAWVDVNEDCVLLEKNARYMDKETLERLANNIKNDGYLTQLPFGILEENGKYKIISGNHRIKGARKAGVKMALILYLRRDEITKDKEKAIQLSHNSITGKDDLSILRDIYLEIDDLLYKEYSGIDEKELLNLEYFDIDSIADRGIALNEVKLMFSDRRVKQVETVIDELGKKLTTNKDMIALINYGHFLKVLTEVKKIENVKNVTVAFLRMIEICEEYIKNEKSKKVQN